MALAVLLLLPVVAMAQGSPASWLQRILDPAAIGIEPWPGAELNRKFSVDTIRLEKDESRRVAVYLAPLEGLKSASAHYEAALGVRPRVTGEDSEFEMHTFVARGGGKYPPAAEGLEVQITRSPWSTGNLQITMSLTPKEAPEAAP